MGLQVLSSLLSKLSKLQQADSLLWVKLLICKGKVLA